MLTLTSQQEVSDEPASGHPRASLDRYSRVGVESTVVVISCEQNAQGQTANLVLSLAELFFGILKGTRERWGDLGAKIGPNIAE